MVDGYDKITAQTSVPYGASLDSINVERYVGTSDRGFPLSLLHLYFTDTIKELTYYKYDCRAYTDSITPLFIVIFTYPIGSGLYALRSA